MKSGKFFIMALVIAGFYASAVAQDAGQSGGAVQQEDKKALPQPAQDISPEVLSKFGVPEGPAMPGGPAETLPKGTPTTETTAGAAPQEELIYLNATDVDIRDMIKQISKATGTNFIIDDKIRGKITIISEKPMTKEMAYQAFLSALDVMGYTTVSTPGGLIKIVQTNTAITEPLDIYKDETPYTDRFITRIVQVSNISANDISQVVRTLVSKEGNLFAYPATNSLILTDTGSNIDRILKIIKELDQEGPQEVIEIIPIQNADATDITQKVLDLFEAETDAGKARGGVRTKKAGGSELEEVPSVSKVITDERTNSIIVLGTKRSILKIRSLIARLDSPTTGVEGTIHVYYLKHANAKEVSDVLNSLVSGAETGAERKGGGPPAPEKKVGAVQLEGGVKVTADESTNSLVITASPKDFQILVEMVIAKLDIPRRQVYLEAVVMELTVDKARTLGLSGNFANSMRIGQNSAGGGGENLGMFGGLLPITPTAISSIAGAAGGLGAGIVTERTFDLSLADGTTVSIPAVSAIIQALERDTDVNILSTPSILTLDNEEAQIQVGQEVPVPSGTTVSSGVTTFNVTREDTGIILKITPQISESDTVRLEITQEVKSVIATDPNLGPTLTKRSVETVVVANDKQTIVIGGLIDDRATVTTNKIPFLGDVPVLGNLFRNRTNQKIKTNIIVFITPYIIRERADYLAILQKKIEERNLFIDLNYGTGQRKQIRESVKSHARELLEYKSAVIDTTGSLPPKVVESPVSSPALSATPSQSGSVNTPPPPAQPEAVKSSSSSRRVRRNIKTR